MHNSPIESASAHIIAVLPSTTTRDTKRQANGKATRSDMSISANDYHFYNQQVNMSILSGMQRSTSWMAMDHNQRTNSSVRSSHY